MSELPAELYYTEDHEWLQLHGDGTATVGITDYAQESLGDITFVEFPDVGTAFQSGETFGVVESVKAASDLFMPVTAEVLEINATVEAEPELLNQDPYKAGWLLKIKIEDDSQLKSLLSPKAYQALI